MQGGDAARMSIARRKYLKENRLRNLCHPVLGPIADIQGLVAVCSQPDPGISEPQETVELRSHTVGTIAIRSIMTPLLTGMICLLLTGCFIPGPWSGGRNSKRPEDKKAPEVIIPVEAALPGQGDISAYYETTARVEAERKSDISAESVGECIKVFAEEGDTVKTGQILAELDKDEAEAAVSQAEVDVRKSQLDLERAVTSLAAGLISQSEHDTTEFAHEQSEKRLDSQKIQFANLTIRAPFDGLITTRNIRQGALVSSGTPAFHIVDPSSYMLTIAPPERELSRLHVGQIAEVTIDALQDEEFTATVRRVNPSVDAATGTIKVVLDFDDETKQKLREAAFARVKLIMETHENALLVPKDSVVEENSRRYIYVIREFEEPEATEDEAGEETESDEETDTEDGASKRQVLATVKDELDTEEASGTPEDEPVWVAERMEVTIGFEDSDHFEILSPLTPSDRLVTNGQHTLKPGSKVKVTNLAEAFLETDGMTTDEALEAAKDKKHGKRDFRHRFGKR